MPTHLRQEIYLLPAVLLVALSLPKNSLATLIYQPTVPVEYDLALDTRAESECREISLANAVCLPPTQLIAGHNRLANFSGLFWLLGTVGLSGSERIVVIGDEPEKRDFIAGWLLVAGQTHITVVDKSVAELLMQAVSTKPGRSRGTTRKLVYTAEPRTDLLLLTAEVHQLLQLQDKPVIFDGRSESEYWGRSIIAARGGHLPGAIHMVKPSDLQTDIQRPVLAYANDSVSGLAYLARLMGNEISAKLYLGGWVEWASDGSLPIDAATYPRTTKRILQREETLAKTRDSGSRSPLSMTLIPALLIIILLIAVLAYQFGRRQGVKA